METIFAAVWLDRVLGPLSMATKDAQSAVEMAQSIRAKGCPDKVSRVVAVRLDPDDKIHILDGEI